MIGPETYNYIVLNGMTMSADESLTILSTDMATPNAEHARKIDNVFYSLKQLLK